MPKQFRKKLDDKAKKLILVGYQDESSNYRLYDPEKKTIIVSRDVTFNETAANESSNAGGFDEKSLKIPRGDEAVEVPDESDEEDAPDDAAPPPQKERIEVRNKHHEESDE